MRGLFRSAKCNTYDLKLYGVFYVYKTKFTLTIHKKKNLKKKNSLLIYVVPSIDETLSYAAVV